MKLEAAINGIFAARLESQETLFVEFYPNMNAKEIIEFTIGTMALPGNRMALSLAFPEGKLYKVPDGPFVLCDITGFSGMTIRDEDGETTELEKAE